MTCKESMENVKNAELILLFKCLCEPLGLREVVLRKLR